MSQSVEQQVQTWLERVVIGLNLCPFAGTPYRNGQVRICESEADTSAALLADLRRELQSIDEAPDRIETTLIAVTRMLSNFEDYNQFLDHVDSLLEAEGWEGIYQVASFHPQYRFAGTEPDDRGNLTNRAPWPILHIIREASIDQALVDHPDPEAIPDRNVQKMQALTAEEVRDLFPWLSASGHTTAD